MAGGDGVELLVGKLMARNLVANQLLGVGKGEVVAVRLARLDERGEAADDGFDLAEQFAVVGEILLKASSFIDGHDAPLCKQPPRPTVARDAPCQLASANRRMQSDVD